jgi:hypothetical protein
MAASCLHCTIRDAIQAHVRENPTHIVNGVPSMKLAEMVEAIGTVLGELAVQAPESARVQMILDAASAALSLAGYDARFQDFGAEAAPDAPQVAH